MLEKLSPEDQNYYDLAETLARQANADLNRAQLLERDQGFMEQSKDNNLSVINDARPCLTGQQAIYHYQEFQRRQKLAELMMPARSVFEE